MKNFMIMASIFAYMPYLCLGKTIETINSIMDEKVVAQLQNADAETLVIFDMDNTLFTIANNKAVTDLNQPLNLLLVEEKMIEVIKNLQERKVKVMALTAVGASRELRRWRVRNLNQIGLDFSTSFDLQEVEFYKLPYCRNIYSAFYQGVLCTAHNPKGSVLIAFLSTIDWRPAKVIFFDDQFSRCVDVAHEMAEYNIPVQCYWYQAADKWSEIKNKIVQDNA